MFDNVLHTRGFDPEQASASELAALHVFLNRISAEQWPDDPPRSLDETVRRLRSVPPFIDWRMWVVWSADERKILAQAQVMTWNVGSNEHLADFYVAVLPEMRRRGIAKGLLGLISQSALERNRRLLLAATDSDVPAGMAFMERIGARSGLVERISQLDLAGLDSSLLDEWPARAQERAGGFELGLWEGPYPDAEIEAIAKMRDVMNTAPREDLDVEDFESTPERMRQVESTLAQREIERWTMYARHVESGELAGYTEVLWNPNQPELLLQDDTAVDPRYRDRGLGRWLKAAMLKKVLRDRPTVKRVRTGNAGSNAPMLRINHELGFKLYKSITVWQVGVDRVLDYLAASEFKRAGGAPVPST
ncbi:MAG: GNAT family N-acetyltransferase [Anaerolineae bacterium]